MALKLFNYISDSCFDVLDSDTDTHYLVTVTQRYYESYKKYYSDSGKIGVRIQDKLDEFYNKNLKTSSSYYYYSSNKKSKILTNFDTKKKYVLGRQAISKSKNKEFISEYSYRLFKEMLELSDTLFKMNYVIDDILVRNSLPRMTARQFEILMSKRVSGIDSLALEIFDNPSLLAEVYQNNEDYQIKNMCISQCRRFVQNNPGELDDEKVKIFLLSDGCPDYSESVKKILFEKLCGLGIEYSQVVDYYLENEDPDSFSEYLTFSFQAHEAMVEDEKYPYQSILSYFKEKGREDISIKIASSLITETYDSKMFNYLYRYLGKDTVERLNNENSFLRFEFKIGRIQHDISLYDIYSCKDLSTMADDGGRSDISLDVDSLYLWYDFPHIVSHALGYPYTYYDPKRTMRELIRSRFSDYRYDYYHSSSSIDEVTEAMMRVCALNHFGDTITLRYFKEGLFGDDVYDTALFSAYIDSALMLNKRITFALPYEMR